MLKKFYLTAALFLLFNECSATPPPYLAATSNQQLVADQLETITTPTGSQILFLTQLDQLNVKETQKVLSQLSGQQYTALFTGTEIINRQFIRRLYDPLRPIISNPLSYEDDVYDLCSADGVKAWIEGTVNRSFLNGNKNASGFKMSGYDISGGAYKRLSSTWTLGAGLCYAIDHFHYNVGGSGKTNTVLGAVYTLYRPAHYYILADVTFGAGTNDLHRKIQFRNAFISPDSTLYRDVKYTMHSRPNITQTAFYGELGVDWNFNCFLLQPFVGFEANRFKRNCKIEKGEFPSRLSAPMRLTVEGKSATNMYSRLGLHLTTPENCYDLTCAFDLAWQYRWNSAHNHLSVRFLEFGDSFNITGVPDERNSLSMAFTVWSEIFEGWTLYVGASGERWKRVSNYDFTAGLIFDW